MEIFQFKTEKETGERLDKVLYRHIAAAGLPHSRERLKGWILEGLVRVDGLICNKPSLLVREESQVSLEIPEDKHHWESPRPAPFELVFEDDSFYVINKPSGVVTHPGAGTTEPTLVEGLLAAGCVLSPVGAPLRGGIVHRLDKDTSGLMVVAKTEAVHHALATMFKSREVHKEYQALVIGAPAHPQGDITEPIGRHQHRRTEMAVSPKGREARSAWRVIDQGRLTALLQIRIFTGRTHQIRVHLAHMGWPVLGDHTYGKSKNKELLTRQDSPPTLRAASRQRVWLRAVYLAFLHPVSGLPMEFILPENEGFKALVF